MAKKQAEKQRQKNVKAILLSQVKSFEKEAERLIGIISQHRDELRELVSKYSDVLESVEHGAECCEDALSDFERAIDRLSETV